MNGVINFYKSAGMTSFSAVAFVRKLTGIKKCGHLGTLDPMAEGVLPICVGYATRFADYLSSVEKQYIAEFQLGIKTDSYDTTGETLSTNDDIIPTHEDITSVISQYKGDREFIVPAFSAKKINGVRAYKLARAGELEDAGKSVMHIKSVELLQYEYPNGIIQVSCGKGTYIRSIISEMGDTLGCGGAMSGLGRTVNGVFHSKDSYNEEKLRNLAENNELSKAVIPVQDLLDYPRAVVKKDVIKHILNGQAPDKSGYLSLPIEQDSDNFFIMDELGNLLGLAERMKQSPTPLKLKMVFN